LGQSLTASLVCCQVVSAGARFPGISKAMDGLR